MKTKKGTRLINLTKSGIMCYDASKFLVAFGVVSSFRCFVVYLATNDIRLKFYLSLAVIVSAS